MPDIVITDEAATIVKEACCQIDALLDMLTNALDGSNRTSHALAVTGRVAQLTGAIFSVLDGEEQNARREVFRPGNNYQA